MYSTILDMLTRIYSLALGNLRVKVMLFFHGIYIIFICYKAVCGISLLAKNTWKVGESIIYTDLRPDAANL